jgi:hypothetical protein
MLLIIGNLNCSSAQRMLPFQWCRSPVTAPGAIHWRLTALVTYLCEGRNVAFDVPLLKRIASRSKYPADFHRLTYCVDGIGDAVIAILGCHDFPKI